MNFLDIFQKLLPFTTSVGNTTEFSLSLEPSDWIITIFSLFLIFLFFYTTFISSRKDKNYLQDISLLIHELSENPNLSISKIDEISSTNEKLHYTWLNFKQNLIHDNSNTYRIFDARDFFNINNLLEKIGKSSYSSIASILLSIGLLGTFIGLFYGLVQLNMDDASTLKDSMRTLIHASGAKFASSIWGLGLSILFTLITKNQAAKANFHINELQNLLNDRFPLKISEQSLVNLENSAQTGLKNSKDYYLYSTKLFGSINSISSDHKNVAESGFSQLVSILSGQLSDNQQYQNEHLSLLRSSLSQQAEIAGKIDHNNQLQQLIVTQSQEQHENLLQKIQQLDDIQAEISGKTQEQIDILNGLALDFAEKLSNQLNESLSKTIAEAMNKSMEMLVKNIGGSEEETLHDALKKAGSKTGENFTMELNKILKDFKRELVESAGVDAKGLSGTMIEINDTAGQLKTAISKMSGELEGLLEQIQAKIDAQATANGNSNTAIQGVASKTATDIQDALNPIKETFEKFNEIIADSKTHIENLPMHLQAFERTTGHLSQSATNTLTASQKLETTTNGLIDAETKLTTNFMNFDGKLNESIIKLAKIPDELNTMVEKVKQISAGTETTYKKLSEQHKDLLQVNQASAKSLEESLQTYKKSTEDYIKAMLDATQTHIKGIMDEVEIGLASYTKESDEHIANNLKIYKEQVEAFIKEADKLTQTTFAQFDGSLVTFANEMASAISELNDAIEILNNRLSKGK